MEAEKNFIYPNFFLYPPEGYKFIASMNTRNKIFDFASKFGISFELQAFLTKIMPLQLVKSYIEILKKPPNGAVLTYALDHLVLRKEPWILEMTFELPYILCGTEKQLELFRGVVKRCLASQHCRRILFQLQVGMEAFIHQFWESFKDKVEVIPRAEFPPPL